MDDLKPCPFCGADDVEYVNPNGCWFAVCYSCEAEGPVAYSADDAAEAWNRRAAPADKQGGGLTGEQRLAVQYAAMRLDLPDNNPEQQSIVRNLRTMLAAAPQPSEKQAEPAAEFWQSHDRGLFSRVEQPAKDARGVDERTAFEAYAASQGYPLDGHGGHYSNIRTRNNWMGWQARALLAAPAEDARGTWRCRCGVEVSGTHCPICEW